MLAGGTQNKASQHTLQTWPKKKGVGWHVSPWLLMKAVTSIMVCIKPLGSGLRILGDGGRTSGLVMRKGMPLSAVRLKRAQHQQVKAV